MTTEIAAKIKSAIETSGITYYQFNTMNAMRMDNNGDNAFAFIDEDLECVHGVRMNYGGSKLNMTDEPFLYTNSGYAEISEFMMAGSRKELEDFFEAMDISLTDEQIKVMDEIAKSRTKMNPITGDYTFAPVSEEEYESMTPEQKEEYDKKKYDYDHRKAGLMYGSVSVGPW